MRTTRRNVLKGGGKVVATVATLPFLSTINPAQAQEDAELFALYERCRWLEKKYMAAIRRHDEAWLPIRRQFPKDPDEAQGKARAAAEERAGLPALEKKQDAACDDWCDALSRLYDTRANTPAGMILKFTAAWGDCQFRSWRTKEHPITSIANNIDFDDRATEAVLLDLERLSGRAI